MESLDGIFPTGLCDVQRSESSTSTVAMVTCLPLQRLGVGCGVGEGRTRLEGGEEEI